MMNNNTAPGTNLNYASFAQRYKTSLCRNWQTTGRCMIGAKCNFAHGQEELRNASDPITDPSVLATAMAYQGQQMQSSKQIRCKYNDIGACRYGYACHFSHSDNTAAQSSAQQYQQQQYILAQQYQQLLAYQQQQQYAYQQQQQYQQQMIQYQQYQQQMMAQQYMQQQQQQQQPPQYPSQVGAPTEINNNGTSNPIQQSNTGPQNNEKTNTTAELQWLEQQSQQLQQQKLSQQQQPEQQQYQQQANQQSSLPLTSNNNQAASTTTPPSVAVFELTNEQKAQITTTQLKYMISEMNKLALSSDVAMKIASANEYLSNNEIQTSSKLLDEIINRKDCSLEEKAQYDSIIQVASKVATDLMKQYQQQAQEEQRQKAS